jgi:hypothetical protein
MGTLFLILLVLHFIPTIVATKRRHNATLPIFILNLFLGWTLVGWVIALVWACTNDVNPNPVKRGEPREWTKRVTGTATPRDRVDFADLERKLAPARIDDDAASYIAGLRRSAS